MMATSKLLFGVMGYNLLVLVIVWRFCTRISSVFYVSKVTFTAGVVVQC